MRARLRIECWPLLLLLAAAVGFFWQATLGGKVLLPVDNLFQFQPWASYAPAGFSGPHNPLISDSILENYGWKRVLLDAIHQRQLPLWNPYILAGTPYLAPGQASVLYPFTALWLVMPLAYAYGYFAALHLFFAGACTYAFLRGGGTSRTAGIVGGLAYMFSSRLVTSILWPQMMGAVVWLPLLLLAVELIMRQATAGRWPVMPACGGALLLGLSIMAGHIEASVYVMAAMGLYGVGRVAVEVVSSRNLEFRRQFVARALISCAALVALGLGVAAGQLLPFYEVGSLNFRSGAASYQDVQSFALKLPQLFTFIMPDFYGNPVLRWAPYWGTKDYVEQAAYVGVLPMMLAGATLVALASAIQARGKRQEARGPTAPQGMLRSTLSMTNGRRSQAPILVSLWLVVLVSLLLAFGTPLYRAIFFLLPGFNQIHSPFRWLIPYTASMALLAGFGFDYVSKHLRAMRKLFALAGIAAAAALVIWLRFVLAHFHPDVRTLEIRNFAIFAGLMMAAAVAAWSGRRAFGLLAVALVAVDLGCLGIGFNTAVDPKLLNLTPRLVSFVQQDHELFRVTAYGQDKMFEANGNALYGLQDARGYDSVIIGRYAQLNGLLEPQDQLQFNRVKPVDRPEVLNSPLLNLLNVKYVLSTQAIDDPQFDQVYAGPDGRVYRNQDVLPRAFVVGDVRVEPDSQRVLQLLSAPGFNPGTTAVVEKPVAPTLTPASPAAAEKGGSRSAAVTTYSGRKVDVTATGPGLLVLTDNNFPGWKATVDDQPAELLTADYTFRGVPLPPGEHRVEFVFAPSSVIIGGLVSGLSLALLAVAFAAYFWQVFAHRSTATPAHTAGRVSKNSLTPLTSNLATKLLSFGFSVYYFRALGLTQVGKYVLATTIWLFMDTVIGFGLQQLVMREVARGKDQANAYLTNATAVRLIVSVLVGVPVVLGVLALRAYAGFDGDTAVVIVILTIGFIPAAFSNVFSHVFDAHELMEYKSFVQVLTQIVSIGLGVVFILAGWDIVGLAMAALIANVFTALLFWALTSRVIVRPKLQFEWHLIRTVFRGAYPIMLNQLLTVFFFKIDVPVLRAFRGNDEVGIYGAAYKFVDAMLIVPATFVPAVFPILSRQAASQREALKRGTDLSLKILLLISLPVLAGFEVFADDIIRGFYGGKFAASALALRILMLFLPFSYVNGLTQYVLIALDKQRTIIRFFAITAVFNVAANLALVPLFGYPAASAVTVGSEVVLLIPLWLLTARELGGTSILAVAGRPVVAAVAAGLAMLALRTIGIAMAGAMAGPVMAAFGGVAIYTLGLLVLRTFSEDEMALVKAVLRRRRANAPAPLPAS